MASDATNLTEQEVHDLFNVRVLRCPNEDCDHELSKDEVQEWIDGDSAWSCPGCMNDIEPEPVMVNRLDEFESALKELSGMAELVKSRLPHLSDRVDEELREAGRLIDSMFATV